MFEHSHDNKPGELEESRLVVDNDFEVAPINDRPFGSLVEHLDRHVYNGIYEPSHPETDEDDFRKDIIELVKELGATTIRCPGGNFVSSYRWEDSVGPHDERLRRLDLAWHSTETSQFGLHGITKQLEKTGDSEPMKAVDLGTCGLEEALDLLEYADTPGGTKLPEEHRANGADQPFGIKIWCLGNEMGGPWQTGYRSIEDYGTLAASAAAGMRAIDPNVELVVCGSSSHVVDTFDKQEEAVPEKTFDNVNFVSCHAYYHPELQPDGTRDMKGFLASGAGMNGFINDITAVIDATKARLKSKYDIFISFGERNIWYPNEESDENPEGIDDWPVAPCPLEDVYSAIGAVVFGDLMTTLLENADRVHAASLAQLINVIASIMTEPGDPAWRQTALYPFSLTTELAKGGTVLEPKLVSGTYETDRYGKVPTINSVAVHGEDGTISVFVVNRLMEATNDSTIKLPEGFALSAVRMQTLHENDLLAKGTLEDQNQIILHPNTTITSDTNTGTVHVTLPLVSWATVHVG